MSFDWSSLRKPAPGSLVAAREAAHYMLQFPARAAIANLKAAPDDSHTAFGWDAKKRALLTEPLPGGLRAGLHLPTLELLLGGEHAATPAALDRLLAKHKLKPASGVKLPYQVPERPQRKDAALEALARWYDAAADVLHEVRGKHAGLRPGPGPARCWPHHFDIAVLVQLEEGAGESARSIGVGVSPGDHYYAQPYAYVSPYPSPKDPQPPALPAGGHWHTKDFFGAVATADELLAQPDPRAALLAVIDAAFAQGRRWLDG